MISSSDARKKKAASRSGKASNPELPVVPKTGESTSAHGRAMLRKFRAEILSAEQRNTAINRAAYTIGGLVAGGEITEADALDMLLQSGRNSGHERYEEAVCNGFSASLQHPIRPTLELVKNTAETGIAPYFPAPHLSREEAIRKHAETIEGWFERAVTYAKAMKDPFLAGGSESKPPRFLLRGAQSVGKTSILVGRGGKPGLLYQTEGLVTVMFLPDHQKCTEAFDDYRRAAEPDTPQALVLQGRGSMNPESGNGDRMCLAHKLAIELYKHGLSVRKTLCPRCPFQKTCGYLRQERRVEDLISSGDGAVIFAPHDYAFLPLPGDARPDLVIFDERPRDFGVGEVFVSKKELEFALSSDANPFLKSRERNRMEQTANNAVQFDAIAPLKHALLQACNDDGTTSLPALKAAGVTKELIVRAIEDLSGFFSRSISHDIKQALSRDGRSLQPDESRKIIAKLAEQVARHQVKPAGRLLSLFEAVRLEIDSDRGTMSGVIADQVPDTRDGLVPGLRVSRIRPLLHGADIPFLHIDGTADPNLARILFGADLEDHHYPVARNAKVTQVTGCTFSKRRLCNEGNVNGKIEEENRRLREDVAGSIDQHFDAAVFANKSVIEALDLDDDSRAGHFGAVRGRNAWERFGEVIVIGREQPREADIERIARAYAAAAGDAFRSGEYFEEPRCIRTTNGAQALDVVTHPDPWAQRILHQVREAEIEQAIDRVRLKHNDRLKQVFLLSPVVIDITVDRVIDWRDFRSGGTRNDRAIEAHRMLIPSPAGCTTWMPDIWSNKQTAARDLTGLDPAQIDAPFVHVRFRPAPRRGRKPHAVEAWVFTKKPWARKTVERLVGDLAEFEILGDRMEGQAVARR